MPDLTSLPPLPACRRIGLCNDRQAKEKGSDSCYECEVSSSGELVFLCFGGKKNLAGTNKFAGNPHLLAPSFRQCGIQFIILYSTLDILRCSRLCNPLPHPLPFSGGKGIYCSPEEPCIMPLCTLCAFA